MVIRLVRLSRKPAEFQVSRWQSSSPVLHNFHSLHYTYHMFIYVLYFDINICFQVFSVQLVMVCRTQFQLRDPLNTCFGPHPGQNVLVANRKSSGICLKDSTVSHSIKRVTTWVTHGPVLSALENLEDNIPHSL